MLQIDEVRRRGSVVQLSWRVNLARSVAVRLWTPIIPSYSASSRILLLAACCGAAPPFRAQFAEGEQLV